MWCNQDNSVHVHPITKSSSPLNFQKVIHSTDKNTAVHIADHIVNTVQRTLFTSRHDLRTIKLNLPTMFDFLLFSSSEAFTILTIHQSNIIEPQQQQNMLGL